MSRQIPASAAEVATEVREIVAQVLGVPADRVGFDDTLDGALGVDSLRMIRIRVALEARFGVVMPDDVPVRTVGDLVASVTFGRHGTEER